MSLKVVSELRNGFGKAANSNQPSYWWSPGFCICSNCCQSWQFIVLLTSQQDTTTNPSEVGVLSFRCVLHVTCIQLCTHLSHLAFRRTTRGWLFCHCQTRSTPVNHHHPQAWTAIWNMIEGLDWSGTSGPELQVWRCWHCRSEICKWTFEHVYNSHMYVWRVNYHPPSIPTVRWFHHSD